MYTIDKCIPIPPVIKESKSKYPYAKMEIGDSFTFYHENKTKVLAAAYGYQKTQKARWTFVYRTITPKYYRIWRTS